MFNKFAATTNTSELDPTIKSLFLDRLTIAKKLDPNQSPFPMSYMEGRHYQMTRRDILEWVSDKLNLEDQQPDEDQPTAEAARQDIKTALFDIKNALKADIQVRNLPTSKENNLAYLRGEIETVIWVLEMIG